MTRISRTFSSTSVRARRSALALATAATAALAVAVAAPASAASGTSPFPSRPSACTEANGRVSTIVVSGRTAYFGGSFTSVTDPGGTTHTRNRAAAIDTATCAVLPWNPNVNGDVLAIAVHGDRVFIGGSFSSVGGATRKDLAEVDPGTGAPTSFKPKIRGYVMALGTSSSRLYAAGRISSVDGQARGNAAAFSLSTGALDPGWTPATDKRIQALAVAPDGSRVYLGGSFTHINGDSGGRHIAAVTPTNGAIDTGFKPKLKVATNEITVSGSMVGAAMAGSGGRVAVFTEAGGLLTSGQTDGNGQAVELVGDEVFLGGHFAYFCAGGTNCSDPVRRTKALSLTISTGALTDWAPQFNSVYGVWALEYDPGTGRLFAGGDFTESGAQSVHHLAMFPS